MNENMATDCTVIKTTVSMPREQKSKPIAAPAPAVVNTEAIRADIEKLRKEIAPVADKTFVMMKNKQVWFDRNNAALFPKFEAGVLQAFNTQNQPTRNYSLDFEGFRFAPMTSNEFDKSFCNGSGNPYLRDNGNFKNFPGGIRCANEILTAEINDRNQSHIRRSNGDESWWQDRDVITIVPICRLRGKNAAAMDYFDAFLSWLECGLLPEGLTLEQERLFSRLISEYPKLKNPTAASTVVEEPPSNPVELIRRQLLDCDKVRANIEPYDEQLLTDIGRGHWELFEPPGEGDTEIELPKDEYWIARPPQMDVRLNGVCAIDFGTKSTVVVCRDGDSRMLRVGKGDYSKAPTPDDFENPTVIELRDLNAFLKEYRARAGRPFTEWEQVTVSHQAADAIFKDNSRGSSIYNSVFDELKQWAQVERKFRLKDRSGSEQMLKPYIQTKAIDEGDFDPIELYAYYLGLYINNMRHKIYVNYILSYPVNYRKEVCEKIRASFERGLRKSLPPALLADDEMMKRFRVYLGASEPAAYAITALEQFKLEPRELGEKTAYGVFDFGGGTTDFDFGIEYVPENHNRNFIVEQFGSSGDALLGGENILELLAYEVYKDSLDEMRAKKISFVLPAGCEAFAGSEALLRENDDSAAHMNNRLLAEKLRPLWECSEERDKLSEDANQLNLFSSAKGEQGSYLVGVQLKIDAEKLNRVIEDRIRIGVENFFQSMASAFRGKDTRPIHIFLAGNSCRSPIVKKLFDEYISKDNAEQYVLHAPLGIDEGAVSTVAELDRQRTGKTGVAFGLIRCRRGGKDVKIVNRNVDKSGQVIFPYLLGTAGYDGKTFAIKINRDVGYGVWKYFTVADEADFEIYYTSESRARQSKMPLSEVSMAYCVIDDDEVSDDDDVGIYIRKVDPNTIEYAVGSADDFSSDFKGKTHSQKL